MLSLGQVEQAHHRALSPPRRIFCDQRVDFLQIFRRESEGGRLFGRDRTGGHRSISPKTISNEPMIATVSASIWPRDMASMAARKAKPGARILHL